MTKYEFVDDNESMQCNIRLLDGPYNGLLYHYGKVKFDEQDDGTASMNFTYNVVDNPKEYEYNQTLTNTLGDILVGILDEQLKEDECQE